MNRPESWNAKMLGGAPLITAKQFERLLANVPPIQTSWVSTHDPVPVVKIFLPHVRWLLCWIYPDNHDLAFAITKFGNQAPKAGDVLISNIVRARLGGAHDVVQIKPERDKYITLDQPLSYYLQHTDW